MITSFMPTGKKAVITKLKKKEAKLWKEIRKSRTGLGATKADIESHIRKIKEIQKVEKQIHRKGGLTSHGVYSSYERSQYYKKKRKK